tara:strand:- start:73 stop:237 length:165 start_codon:yes stop_codon:yes gene_type:complete
MKVHGKEYERFIDFFVGGAALDVNDKTMNENKDVECEVLSDDVVEAMLSKVMVN